MRALLCDFDSTGISTPLLFALAKLLQDNNHDNNVMLVNVRYRSVNTVAALVSA